MVRRVGIVVLGDIKTKIDGISNYYNQFINYFKDKDIEIHFFISTIGKEKVIVDKNIFFHYVMISFPFEFYPGLSISKNPFSHMKLYRKFKVMFQTQAIDVVQIASPDPFSFSGLLAARNLNIPIITVYHTKVDQYAEYWLKHYQLISRSSLVPYILKPFTRSVNLLNYLSLRLADRIVTPTKQLKREFVEKGMDQNRISVIGRGVHSAIFKPGKKDTKNKKLTILYVGRISPEKNLDILDFLKDYPNIQLTIVGDGNYIKKLKKKLPFAFFTGPLKGKKLYEAYAKADFFVFPSQSDTFGNVVLEAMSAELPIVGFKNVNLEDRVANGKQGFLTRSIKEFEEKTALLISDGKLRKRLGKAAREKAKTFSWPSIFDKQKEEFFLAKRDLKEKSFFYYFFSFNSQHAFFGSLFMFLIVFLSNSMYGFMPATKSGLGQFLLSFFIIGFNTALFEKLYAQKRKLLSVLVPTLTSVLFAAVLHLAIGTPALYLTLVNIMLMALINFTFLSFVHKTFSTIDIVSIYSTCKDCLFGKRSKK